MKKKLDQLKIDYKNDQTGAIISLQKTILGEIQKEFFIALEKEITKTA